MDHYSLGYQWEKAVKSSAKQLMVIDDLARSHDCDLILNQNMLANNSSVIASRYQEDQKLMGTRFAIIDNFTTISD